MDDQKDIETFEVQQKKNNKRLPLFVTIILMVVMLGAGFFLGQLFFLNQFQKRSGVDAARISKKISLLGTLVNQYFYEDYDAEDLESGAYYGFLSGLDDPYSQYYSKSEYDQLMEEDKGEYKGIGVSVSKDSVTNYVKIEEVFKDDPAYNAGLQTGDYIIKVEGKETSDMMLTEVVQNIKKGPDPVAITILRDGKQKEYKIEKKTIDIKSVKYEMKEDKIGYISISQFIDNTDEEFVKAVDTLEKQGMKGMIIDLRDDGGGLLVSCCNIVSRIIPKGDLIVYTEDKQKERTDYCSDSDKVVKVPIVILVNGNTASASEILTGCLKDYSLATVIGTKTFGKGIVQNIFPLSDGSAVKLTISAYYSPKGLNFNKNGIQPDEEIKISDEEWKKARKDPSKDRQLKRAIELLKKK